MGELEASSRGVKRSPRSGSPKSMEPSLDRVGRSRHDIFKEKRARGTRRFPARGLRRASISRSIVSDRTGPKDVRDARRIFRIAPKDAHDCLPDWVSDCSPPRAIRPRPPPNVEGARASPGRRQCPRDTRSLPASDRSLTGSAGCGSTSPLSRSSLRLSLPRTQAKGSTMSKSKGGRSSGQAARDNRANQLNQNNGAYWSSRGEPAPDTSSSGGSTPGDSTPPSTGPVKSE